ncbi:MAG: hypothetical protein ACUVV0_05165 [Anaerolineae bacterium]
MDAELVRKYCERWEAVAAKEAEEWRNASLTRRWEQLNAIFRLAIGLGLPLTGQDEEEIAQVRQRWAILKEAYEREPERGGSA